MAKLDLFEAIRKGSLRQLTLLLESGCDVNCRNDNSETPLMVAIYRLRNKEQRERAIKQLLQADADVNARNRQGRTPLAFACALDQTETIKLLLQKKSVDVNQGDLSGVTPLMLSVALGNRAAVSTLMQFARGGNLHLNLQAKDDSEFTALDYAAASGNNDLAESLQGRSKSTPGARAPGSRLNNNTSIKNMNHSNSRFARNGKPYKAGEAIEMADVSPPALQNSNLPAIQQFGRAVRGLQAENDASLAALRASSNSSSADRSGAKGSAVSSSVSSPRDLPHSQERAVSRTGSLGKERPTSKVSSQSRSSLITNEDDDDLDLNSLRDLMGTVRKAAQEIREIVEPIQKEGRERQREQKRRSKKKHSSHHQQIQAEIHVISEINGRPVPPLPPTIPKIPTAPLEETLPPSAFLHVENEELSHTWPRQKGRSVSRERSLSRGGALQAGPCSEGSSPLATAKLGLGMEAHKVPADAAKSEREILEKVVGRKNSGPDPLVSAINSINTTPKSRQIIESRHRIVGRARDHWSTQKQPQQSQLLPHITVQEHSSQEQSVHLDEAHHVPVDEELPIDLAEQGEVRTEVEPRSNSPEKKHHAPAPPWQDSEPQMEQAEHLTDALKSSPGGATAAGSAVRPGVSHSVKFAPKNKSLSHPSYSKQADQPRSLNKVTVPVGPISSRNAVPSSGAASKSITKSAANAKLGPRRAAP